MKKLKIRRIVFLILFIVIISYAIITVIPSFKKEETKKPVAVINEIKEYGYTLDENEIKIYKTDFKKLKTLLEEEDYDEEEYASYISKLFIYDFYNLSNKHTNSDIGGVQFLHLAAKDNFILKAQDTMYKYLESDITSDRTQELPTVKSVEVIEVNNESYQYNDEKDNSAYKVTLSVIYEKDLGYPTEITIYLVHETEKKLSIVEIN